MQLEKLTSRAQNFASADEEWEPDDLCILLEEVRGRVVEFEANRTPSFSLKFKQLEPVLQRLLQEICNKFLVRRRGRCCEGCLSDESGENHQRFQQLEFSGHLSVDESDALGCITHNFLRSDSCRSIDASAADGNSFKVLQQSMGWQGWGWQGGNSQV